MPRRIVRNGKVYISAWDCSPIPFRDDVYLKLEQRRQDVCVVLCDADGRRIAAGYVLGINQAGIMTKFQGVTDGNGCIRVNRGKIDEVDEHLYMSNVETLRTRHAPSSVSFDEYSDGEDEEEWDEDWDIDYDPADYDDDF